MDKALRPLTLLMVAACAWALGLLALAALGLGGRQELLPDGAAEAPSLPSMTLRAPAPRLREPGAYGEVGERPLLNFDRRPVAVAVAEDAEGGGELDAILTSVMITAKLQLAIVRKNEGGTVHRVKMGERVEGTGWTLVSLEPRRALFEGPGGQKALDLRGYDGRGGEAPTAVAAAPAQPIPQAPEERPGPVAQAAPPPPPPTQPLAATSTNSNAAPANAPAPMTQEQQIEAIRRRIEARRAQMRQEAARAAAQPSK